MSKVLILGGDGYCGWPLALRLSQRGDDVCIVDNLVRRHQDDELGASSLTPIVSIQERCQAWKQKTNRTIDFVYMDIAQNYADLLSLLQDLRPEIIIHYAKQRSAPYSMKSPRHKLYTIDNNVKAGHNIVLAMLESGLIQTRLVHLGTMGVYGYDTPYPISEGYFNVQCQIGDKLEEMEIHHPMFPGSIYHLTKTIDQSIFEFYAKNDGLSIVNVNQGIVWGTLTEEMEGDERLINRFDYDGDFGTVLNRFITQAVLGIPMTVYGKGNQSRAFIEINDSIQSIENVIKMPLRSDGKVTILNQITEVFRIKELAEMVSSVAGAPFQHIKNPRKENEDCDLTVNNDTIKSFDFRFNKVEKTLKSELFDVVNKYKDNYKEGVMMPSSFWSKNE